MMSHQILGPDRPGGKNLLSVGSDSGGQGSGGEESAGRRRRSLGQRDEIAAIARSTLRTHVAYASSTGGSRHTRAACPNGPRRQLCQLVVRFAPVRPGGGRRQPCAAPWRETVALEDAQKCRLQKIAPGELAPREPGRTSRPTGRHERSPDQRWIQGSETAPENVEIRPDHDFGGPKTRNVVQTSAQSAQNVRRGAPGDLEQRRTAFSANAQISPITYIMSFRLRTASGEAQASPVGAGIQGATDVATALLATGRIATRRATSSSAERQQTLAPSRRVQTRSASLRACRCADDVLTPIPGSRQPAAPTHSALRSLSPP